MAKIVGVRKASDGDLMEFKLDTDQVFSYGQAIAGIKNGYIEGCNIGKDRNGNDTIRSNNDGDPDNNLSELPEF